MPLFEPELRRAYDAVRSYVLASGGDGDGWILSDSWREIADLCEQWEDGRYFVHRTNHDGWISLGGDVQDMIGFAPPDFAPSFSDFTVTLL